MTEPMHAVAYLRVSTREQGHSGLGLEAQRAAIEAFAARENVHIASWYTEVASGKQVSDTLHARPELAAALGEAKATGATIVVAKLDRLSRDTHFVTGLMAQRVPFVAVDLGKDADNFMLGLFALLAERERTLNSQRTTSALAALKARGVKLGSPNPGAGGRAQHALALARAKASEPEIISALEKCTTLRAAAAKLNWPVSRLQRMMIKLGLRQGTKT